MDRKDKIYPRLERLLKDRNMSLYQLGKETGIADSTLYEWKCDQYTPKLDKLLTIAKHLEVPITELIE